MADKTLYVNEFNHVCKDLTDGRVLIVCPMTFGKGRLYIQRSKSDLSLEGGW